MTTNHQSVVELRRKVNEAQKVINMDLGKFEHSVRTGIEGRQNKARQEIDTLKASLASKILENATTMLLLRDVSITPAVVQVAREKKDNVITLDFLSIEKGLVKSIYGDNAKLYPFNTGILNRMNILISDEIGEKIKAIAMPQVVAPQTMYGNSTTREEIINKFETLLTAAYDTELKQHLFRTLLIEGVYDRLQQDEIAVFIVNVPKKFVQTFSSYTGKTITVTEDVSMVGALTVTPESSAEELVGAVTKAQALVNKKTGRGGAANRRKQIENVVTEASVGSDQQDVE